MKCFFSLFAFCLLAANSVWACNNAGMEQTSLIKCLGNNQNDPKYPIRLIIRFDDTKGSIIIFSQSIPKIVFQNQPEPVSYHSHYFSEYVDHTYALTGDVTFSVGEETFKKTHAGIVVGNKSFPVSASLGFALPSTGKPVQIYPDSSLKGDKEVSRDVTLYFSDIVYVVVVKNAELKDIRFDKAGKQKQEEKFVTLEGEIALTVFGVGVRSEDGSLYINGQLVSDHQRVVIEKTGQYTIGSH